MSLVQLPDGSYEDRPDANAQPLQPGGLSSVADAALEANDDFWTGAFNDPAGTAVSAGRGAVRGLFPIGGSAVVRGVDDLVTQSTDDPTLANRWRRLDSEHAAAGVLGGLGGSLVIAPLGLETIGASALGRAGGAIAANTVEGAVINGLDRGLDRYTEDLLENRGLSAELMASRALGATLSGAAWGGGAGLLLGSGLAGAAGAYRGIARAADSVGNPTSVPGIARMEARSLGVSDEAMEVAIRSADPSTAPASIDASPVGDLAQAVRRAQAEGVENMVQRTWRQSSDEVARAIPAIERTAVSRNMLDPHVAAGMAEPQRVAADNAHRTVTSAYNLLRTQPDWNDAAPGLEQAMRWASLELNGASPATALEAMSNAVRTVDGMRAGLPDDLAVVVDDVVNSLRTSMTDEATWGRAASIVRAHDDAIRSIRTVSQNMRAGTATAADLEKAVQTADMLSGVAEESLARGAAGRAAKGASDNVAAANVLRSAMDRIAMAEKVARISDELSQISKDALPTAESVSRRLARAGVMGALGGLPGIVVGELGQAAQAAIRDPAARRAAIWAAQNAYERFTNQTAAAILTYVRHPRPKGPSLDFTAAQYDAAVDAVKRSASIPTAPSSSTTLAPRGKKRRPNARESADTITPEAAEADRNGRLMAAWEAFSARK